MTTIEYNQNHFEPPLKSPPKRPSDAVVWTSFCMFVTCFIVLFMVFMVVHDFCWFLQIFLIFRHLKLWLPHRRRAYFTFLGGRSLGWNFEVSIWIIIFKSHFGLRKGRFLSSPGVPFWDSKMVPNGSHGPPNRGSCLGAVHISCFLA